ncbi:hypothetical protein F5Y16DRAFT_325906 [Xylariaceae sp. FL0255]|nr:hypothetical protein F5Y16DRAFT_325906 [Xylariaceae sp. FL0255]
MGTTTLPVKRKPKSRFGCRNCKLRKLKCDELKPSCRRCQLYGVLCNFAFNIPDLQPLSEQRDKPHATVVTWSNAIPSPRPGISNAIWALDGIAPFELDLKDQALFDRFRWRTGRELEAPAIARVWTSYMLEASFTSQFLMHGILALTSVHDRYLGVTPPHHRSLRESYHWAQCTILFNEWLRPPIREEKKDPVWGTASILGILAFASIHARDYREAWPLKTPEDSDLEWVRLGHSKMKLWHIVNPLRSGSVFRFMAETYLRMQEPIPTKGIGSIPPDLAQLCGITEDSSIDDGNPYFTFVHGLARLLRIPKGSVSLGAAMGASAAMRGELNALLAKKDPVALLLLALWYNKARESKWWIDFRARYELPAICVYLQRQHADKAAVQSLIPWEDVYPLM